MLKIIIILFKRRACIIRWIYIDTFNPSSILAFQCFQCQKIIRGSACFRFLGRRCSWSAKRPQSVISVLQRLACPCHTKSIPVCSPCRILLLDWSISMPFSTNLLYIVITCKTVFNRVLYLFYPSFHFFSKI